MAEIVNLARRRRQRRIARDFAPVLARQAAMTLRTPVGTAAIALALPPTARISGINPVFPVYGTPTTVTVRDNFQAAKDEIEELQNDKLDLAGGVMTGPITFADNQLIDGGAF